MSYRLKTQLAVLLFCFNSFALAEQRWLQVELIVFQQQAANSEIFTQIDTEIEPVKSYARAIAGTKSLHYIYKKLKRASNYQPFYYQSWRISVNSNSVSLPIDISGVDRNLSGWIKIQRGDLLHVIADIEYSPPVSVGEKLVYHLIEKRRLLLNEVHYLDHPMYGAVIKVSPVE